MINKLFFTFLFLFSMRTVKASDLPIDTLNSKDITKPLVLYISGDGGFNSFSKQFMQQWNKNGYPVVALNSKSYFWKTKTPGETSKDVSSLIIEYLALWKRSEVILVGYSFGADVIPFIQTRLTPDLISKINHTILLSPSKNTDFTVHLFYGDNYSNSVSDEINKLNKPLLIIFGEGETNLPENEIKNIHATILKIHGEHHYNNETAAVVDDIIKRL